MAEHDDELDRRIHDLLGVAQSDAPAPGDGPAVRVVSASPPARRWPVYAALAAAAAVLGLVGVVTLQRDDTDTTSVATVPPTPSTPDTSTSPSTATSPPDTTSPAVDPATCGRNLATPYEERGSMHTVVPAGLPVDVTIEAPRVLCTGGFASAQVTLTNRSSSSVDVDDTQLVLGGGVDKWVAGMLPGLPLAAGASATVDVSLAVPTITPGSYSLFLYGFDGDAEVVVAGPVICGTGQLTTAVVQEDGALTSHYSVTRVTNQDDVPCALPGVLVVEGRNLDAAPQLVTLEPGAGPFDGMITPLADLVLDPGEQADLWLTTSTTCTDDQPAEVRYDLLLVQLGLEPNGDTDRLMPIGQDVNVACGIWLSGWAEPTAE